MKIPSPRVTPAMAVAILALVVALSSSATAALMITGAQVKNGTISGQDIKDKSVTGKDLKKKTVGKKHLKKNAITTKQVKDASLTGSDLRFGTITGEHLKDGTITTTDLSKNVIEALGGGASGFEVVNSASGTAAGPILVTRTAAGTCPAGKVAIAANAYNDGPADVAAPQVRRTGPASFTAQDPFPLALIGADKIQLQVTCLSAG